MPGAGSFVAMRVKERELSKSLEQMLMGERRFCYRMPVSRRNPTHGDSQSASSRVPRMRLPLLLLP